MTDQPADPTTTQGFPEEWLSPTEICRELQIPLPTFYQWRSRGIGPHAYKIGRHVRVSRTDLDAWISLQSET
jgi:excisionase family DNA binding protein